MQDHEIIALYFDRNERAIIETAQQYGKLCHKVAMNILNNRSDAEECVNDTYLKLWQSIPPERPRSLSAFVCRIARNLAIDRYRTLHKRGYNRDMEVALEELAETMPDTDASGEVLREVLALFVQSLEETDRRLFLGRYWYACSVKDLAKAWGMTPNAVSVRLYKIREKLKQYLLERGYRYE
ncbi:MAG: sigma-70 family RNA polymerase sigma factor [Ruminococcaceae bacterium]|nr:sigma-70 family RNA polymerase sigma factor [Oscillospiraceae bacterium]